MKIALLLVTAILCVNIVGCKSAPGTRVYRWQNKAAQVTVGMTRAEVEKLLPPHPQSPVTTTGTGSGQGVTYWVDANWVVTVAYDYTGVLRDEKGAALDTYSSENRVLMAPVLSRRMMPPVIEVTTIETIEQNPGGDSLKAAPQE
jgi:hypothetical protein